MRLKSFFLLGCLIMLALVVATPLFWQWSYRNRLTHQIPVGSTRNDFQKALKEGRLGQSMPRLGYAFCKTFEFHGLIYTIVAYPVWDSTEHLAGYSLYPKISIRGHAFWLFQRNSNLDKTVSSPAAK